MKLINKIAVLLLLLAFAFPAVAEEKPYFSGQELLNDCTSKKALPRGFCIGFVNGLVNGYVFSDRNTYLCPPANSNVGQWERVIIKYLEDNPQMLHEPASVLAINAMFEAFPCPAK